MYHCLHFSSLWYSNDSVWILRRWHHDRGTSNQQLLQAICIREPASRAEYVGQGGACQGGTACEDEWAVFSHDYVCWEGKLEWVWSRGKGGLQHFLAILCFLDSCNLFLRLLMTPPFYSVCVCMRCECGWASIGVRKRRAEAGWQTQGNRSGGVHSVWPKESLSGLTFLFKEEGTEDSGDEVFHSN